jgi:hypothetical protein
MGDWVDRGVVHAEAGLDWKERRVRSSKEGQIANAQYRVGHRRARREQISRHRVCVHVSGGRVPDVARDLQLRSREVHT